MTDIKKALEAYKVVSQIVKILEDNGLPLEGAKIEIKPKDWKDMPISWQTFIYKKKEL